MPNDPISAAVSDVGSFRDPFGQIFYRNGEVFRAIFPEGAEDYTAARDAGVFRDLQSAGLLIGHEECSLDTAPNGAVYCLRHPRLPFVSYPWEWCFSHLKHAALLHLDVMDIILPKGFWLRDASAFNTQFDGSRFRLIDTLSIGKKPEGSPWVAYHQFCSHFLCPLALASRDVRILGLWRNQIDGFPIDFAAHLLPFRLKMRPGIIMHLLLHAKYQSRVDLDAAAGSSTTGRRLSLEGLKRIVHSLRKTIQGLSPRIESRIWDRYESVRTYDDPDVRIKSEFLRAAVDQLRPGIVWDLGANLGEFSDIASEKGALVVSIDGDPACTELQFQKRFAKGSRSAILPLTMDLANPSPGLGWAGVERSGLTGRAPADLVLALALVHHLVFSSSIPLHKVADWFAALSRNLVIEFVPPDDPMVRKLTQNRPVHLPYTREVFDSAFARRFEVMKTERLPNGRILFLLRRIAA